MMKVIVGLLFLIIPIMGLLAIIGLGLAYFFPPKEKDVEIIIEIKREGEKD